MILMFLPTFHSLGKACSIFVAAFVINVAGCFWTHAADFRINSIRITNNDVRLNWNAPGGSNYVVQVSTHLGSNFVNLGPTNFIPSGGDQLLSYTNVGARTSAASRFYRVRAFAPARLEIQPTNAMIAPNMTNRFKVFLVDSDNVTNDITANAFLSVTSLTSVAQFVRITTNGFAAVRGISVGIAQIRAVYQGVSNTVSLTVSNMNGGMFSVPSSFSGYVEGQSSVAKVFGIFGNKTVNITPAADLGGFGASVTRVDRYNVATDVANSFALVTGQSAADDSIVFTAGASNTPAVPVHWCGFIEVTLQPTFININVGETQEVSVIGHRADSQMLNAVGNIDSVSLIGSVARVERDGVTFRVVGLADGYTGLNVYVNNPVNCGIISTFGYVTVTAPPPPPTPPVITNEPRSITVVLSNTATFSIGAEGTQPLHYRWQFNGADVSGATASMLTIPNANYSNEGNYRVIITNAYGSATSSVATLRVVEVTLGPIAIALWTNRYNGPGNDDDEARAIAVDSNGNAFVTGYSANNSVSPINDDYATIKYSAAGVPLRTNRYNGPGNGVDIATEIAIDGSGNAIVSGLATVSGGSTDYATIKYSNAGVPVWTNRYNGPGNSNDFARALTVDGSGNVFVTGGSAGSGSSSDFATIKYSSSGSALRTNRYNGPANGSDEAQAIGLDSSGNVFVTGYATVTGGTFDYATIKYSNAGVPLWTNRYNGPANSNDLALALVVDGDGNVIVTGYSIGSVSSNDYATIKYSGAGVPLWTNRYNSSLNGDDRAFALAVDGSNNVIVAGYAPGINSEDFITIKYTSAGNPVWTNRYNGPRNQDDRPSAIATDSSGNVIVTGFANASFGSGGDYATIKYSPDGAIVWVNVFDGTSTDADLDRARALAVDGRGNVFVTGVALFNGFQTDYATIKYCSGVPPANDSFGGRIALVGSEPTTSASNDCGSKEPGEPSHAGNLGGRSLWWTWTAPEDGPVLISTCGSSFDTLLSVYTGSAINALTLVASNDNSFCSGVSNTQSQAQFNAVAGTEYQIAVDGYRFLSELTARSGDVSLRIRRPQAFVQWNFNSLIPDEDATTGTFVPAVGTGTVAYVGGVVDASGEFRSGSFNDSNQADNSAWDTANYPSQGTQNKTAGVRFNVSTVGKDRIVIAWDRRTSSKASKYMRLQYSTNGVNFIDHPVTTSVATTEFESHTATLDNRPGVSNNPNFAFRLVAEFESTAIGTANANYVGVSGTYTGGGIFSGGGSIRFDRVTVSGVTFP
jgi:uncharacterized delta-60 repeat protein